MNPPDEASGGPELFPLGLVTATVNALNMLPPEALAQALFRHSQDDWGGCWSQRLAANDEALLDGSRLFSVYHTLQGKAVWVLTEADRSTTTVLLPEDY